MEVPQECYQHSFGAASEAQAPEVCYYSLTLTEMQIFLKGGLS